MRIGTTPTHIFVLPVKTDQIKDVLIVYSQNDTEVFKKVTKDCSFDEEIVSVTLSQEDTLMLDHNSNVQIQIRVVSKGGVAYASRIFVVTAQQCLSEGVI